VKLLWSEIIVELHTFSAIIISSRYNTVIPSGGLAKCDHWSCRNAVVE